MFTDSINDLFVKLTKKKNLKDLTRNVLETEPEGLSENEIKVNRSNPLLKQFGSGIKPDNLYNKSGAKAQNALDFIQGNISQNDFFSSLVKSTKEKPAFPGFIKYPYSDNYNAYRKSFKNYMNVSIDANGKELPAPDIMPMQMLKTNALTGLINSLSKYDLGNNPDEANKMILKMTNPEEPVYDKDVHNAWLRANAQAGDLLTGSVIKDKKKVPRFNELVNALYNYNVTKNNVTALEQDFPGEYIGSKFYNKNKKYNELKTKGKYPSQYSDPDDLLFRDGFNSITKTNTSSDGTVIPRKYYSITEQKELDKYGKSVKKKSDLEKSVIKEYKEQGLTGIDYASDVISIQGGNHQPSKAIFDKNEKEIKAYAKVNELSQRYYNENFEQPNMNPVELYDYFEKIDSDKQKVSKSQPKITASVPSSEAAAEIGKHAKDMMDGITNTLLEKIENSKAATTDPLKPQEKPQVYVPKPSEFSVLKFAQTSLFDNIKKVLPEQKPAFGSVKHFKSLGKQQLTPKTLETLTELANTYYSPTSKTSLPDYKLGHHVQPKWMGSNPVQDAAVGNIVEGDTKRFQEIEPSLQKIKKDYSEQKGLQKAITFQRETAKHLLQNDASTQRMRIVNSYGKVNGEDVNEKTLKLAPTSEYEDAKAKAFEAYHNSLVSRGVEPGSAHYNYMIAIGDDEGFLPDLGEFDGGVLRYTGAWGALYGGVSQGLEWLMQPDEFSPPSMDRFLGKTVIDKKGIHEIDFIDEREKTNFINTISELNQKIIASKYTNEIEYKPDTDNPFMYGANVLGNMFRGFTQNVTSPLTILTRGSQYSGTDIVFEQGNKFLGDWMALEGGNAVNGEEIRAKARELATFQFENGIKSKEEYENIMSKDWAERGLDISTMAGDIAFDMFAPIGGFKIAEKGMKKTGEMIEDIAQYMGKKTAKMQRAMNLINPAEVESLEQFSKLKQTMQVIFNPNKDFLISGRLVPGVNKILPSMTESVTNMALGSALSTLLEFNPDLTPEELARNVKNMAILGGVNRYLGNTFGAIARGGFPLRNVTYATHSESMKALLGYLQAGDVLGGAIAQYPATLIQRLTDGQPFEWWNDDIAQEMIFNVLMTGHQGYKMWNTIRGAHNITKYREMFPAVEEIVPAKDLAQVRETYDIVEETDTGLGYSRIVRENTPLEHIRKLTGSEDVTIESLLHPEMKKFLNKKQIKFFETFNKSLLENGKSNAIDEIELGENRAGKYNRDNDKTYINTTFAKELKKNGYSDDDIMQKVVFEMTRVFEHEHFHKFVEPIIKDKKSDGYKKLNVVFSDFADKVDDAIMKGTDLSRLKGHNKLKQEYLEYDAASGRTLMKRDDNTTSEFFVDLMSSGKNDFVNLYNKVSNSNLPKASVRSLLGSLKEMFQKDLPVQRDLLDNMLTEWGQKKPKTMTEEYDNAVIAKVQDEVPEMDKVEVKKAVEASKPQETIFSDNVIDEESPDLHMNFMAFQTATGVKSNKRDADTFTKSVDSFQQKARDMNRPDLSRVPALQWFDDFRKANPGIPEENLVSEFAVYMKETESLIRPVDELTNDNIELLTDWMPEFHANSILDETVFMEKELLRNVGYARVVRGQATKLGFDSARQMYEKYKDMSLDDAVLDINKRFSKHEDYATLTDYQKKMASNKMAREIKNLTEHNLHKCKVRVNIVKAKSPKDTDEYFFDSVTYEKQDDPINDYGKLTSQIQPELKNLDLIKDSHWVDENLDVKTPYGKLLKTGDDYVKEIVDQAEIVQMDQMQFETKDKQGKYVTSNELNVFGTDRPDDKTMQYLNGVFIKEGLYTVPKEGGSYFIKIPDKYKSFVDYNAWKNKSDRAFKFSKHVNNYMFWRHIASDATWGGVPRGKKLGYLRNYMDFDVMLKLLKDGKSTLEPQDMKDLLKGVIPEDFKKFAKDVNLDVNEIMSKANEFFRNEEGIMSPEQIYGGIRDNKTISHENNSNFRVDFTAQQESMVNALTAIFGAPLNKGGKHTYKIKGNEVDKPKFAWKYAPLIITAQSNFFRTSKDLAKSLYDADVIEGAQITDNDRKTFKLKNIDGEEHVMGMFWHNTWFENYIENPLVREMFETYDNDKGGDGAFGVINDDFAKLLAVAHGQTESLSIYKPKWAYENNGNNHLGKGAFHYNKISNPELFEQSNPGCANIKRLGNNVGIVISATSIKNPEAFNTVVKYDSELGANIGMDQAGKVLFVEKNGKYDQSKEEIDKVHEYIVKNLLEGKVPELIQEYVPLTGKKAMVFDVPKHETKKTGMTLFGIDGIGSALYPGIFMEGGKKGDELLRNFRTLHDNAQRVYMDNGARHYAEVWHGLNMQVERGNLKDMETFNNSFKFVAKDLKRTFQNLDDNSLSNFIGTYKPDRAAINSLFDLIQGHHTPSVYIPALIAAVPNFFTNGKNLLQRRSKEYTENAMMTRTSATQLVLQTEFASRYNVRNSVDVLMNMWDTVHLLGKKEDVSDGDFENRRLKYATDLKEKALRMEELYIDPDTGKLKKMSNGIIVSKDWIIAENKRRQRYNIDLGPDAPGNKRLKPLTLGSKVMASRVPVDAPDGTGSFVIAAVSDDIGTCMVNPDFGVAIWGTDYDKDGITLRTEDAVLDKNTFNFFWDYINNSGMMQGGLKGDIDKYKKQEKVYKGNGNWQYAEEQGLLTEQHDMINQSNGYSQTLYKRFGQQAKIVNAATMNSVLEFLYARKKKEAFDKLSPEEQALEAEGNKKKAVGTSLFKQIGVDYLNQMSINVRQAMEDFNYAGISKPGFGAKDMFLDSPLNKDWIMENPKIKNMILNGNRADIDGSMLKTIKSVADIIKETSSRDYPVDEITPESLLAANESFSEKTFAIPMIRSMANQYVSDFLHDEATEHFDSMTPQMQSKVESARKLLSRLLAPIWIKGAKTQNPFTQYFANTEHNANHVPLIGTLMYNFSKNLQINKGAKIFGIVPGKFKIGIENGILTKYDNQNHPVYNVDVKYLFDPNGKLVSRKAYVDVGEGMQIPYKGNITAEDILPLFRVSGPNIMDVYDWKSVSYRNINDLNVPYMATRLVNLITDRLSPPKYITDDAGVKVTSEDASSVEMRNAIKTYIGFYKPKEQGITGQEQMIEGSVLLPKAKMPAEEMGEAYNNQFRDQFYEGIGKTENPNHDQLELFNDTQYYTSGFDALGILKATDKTPLDKDKNNLYEKAIFHLIDSSKEIMEVTNSFAEGLDRTRDWDQHTYNDEEADGDMYMSMANFVTKGKKRFNDKVGKSARLFLRDVIDEAKKKGYGFVVKDGRKDFVNEEQFMTIAVQKLNNEIDITGERLKMTPDEVQQWKEYTYALLSEQHQQKLIPPMMEDIIDYFDENTKTGKITPLLTKMSLLFHIVKAVQEMKWADTYTEKRNISLSNSIIPYKIVRQLAGKSTDPVPANETLTRTFRVENGEIVLAEKNIGNVIINKAVGVDTKAGDFVSLETNLQEPVVAMSIQEKTIMIPLTEHMRIKNTLVGRLLEHYTNNIFDSRDNRTFKFLEDNNIDDIGIFPVKVAMSNNLSDIVYNIDNTPDAVVENLYDQWAKRRYDNLEGDDKLLFESIVLEPGRNKEKIKQLKDGIRTSLKLKGVSLEIANTFRQLEYQAKYLAGKDNNASTEGSRNLFSAIEYFAKQADRFRDITPSDMLKMFRTVDPEFMYKTLELLAKEETQGEELSIAETIEQIELKREIENTMKINPLMKNTLSFANVSSFLRERAEIYGKEGKGKIDFSPEDLAEGLNIIKKYEAKAPKGKKAKGITPEQMLNVAVEHAKEVNNVQGYAYDIAHRLNLPGYERLWTEISSDEKRDLGGLARRIIKQKINDYLTENQMYKGSTEVSGLNFKNMDELVYSNGKMIRVPDITSKVDVLDLIKAVAPDKFKNIVSYSYASFYHKIDGIVKNGMYQMEAWGRRKYMTDRLNNRVAENAFLGWLATTSGKQAIFDTKVDPTALKEAYLKGKKDEPMMPKAGTHIDISFNNGSGYLNTDINIRESDYYKADQNTFRETTNQAMGRFIGITHLDDNGTKVPVIAMMGYSDTAEQLYVIPIDQVKDIYTGEPYKKDRVQNLIHKYACKRTKSQEKLILQKISELKISSGKVNQFTMADFGKGIKNRVKIQGTKTYKGLESGEIQRLREDKELSESLRKINDRTIDPLVVKSARFISNALPNMMYFPGISLAEMAIGITGGITSLATLNPVMAAFFAGMTIKGASGFVKKVGKLPLQNIFGTVGFLIRHPIYKINLKDYSNMGKIDKYADMARMVFAGWGEAARVGFDLLSNMSAAKQSNASERSSAFKSKIEEITPGMVESNIIDESRALSKSESVKTAKVLKKIADDIAKQASLGITDWHNYRANALNDFIRKNLRIVETVNGPIPLFKGVGKGGSLSSPAKSAFWEAFQAIASINGKIPELEVHSTNAVVAMTHEAGKRKLEILEQLMIDMGHVPGDDYSQAYMMNRDFSQLTKSIGEYTKTVGNNTTSGRMLTLFGRFKHEATLDATTYWFHRKELWKAMEDIFKDDPALMAVIKKGNLPFGNNTLENYKRELGRNMFSATLYKAILGTELIAAAQLFLNLIGSDDEDDTLQKALNLLKKEANIGGQNQALGSEMAKTALDPGLNTYNNLIDLMVGGAYLLGGDEQKTLGKMTEKVTKSATNMLPLGVYQRVIAENMIRGFMITLKMASDTYKPDDGESEEVNENLKINWMFKLVESLGSSAPVINQAQKNYDVIKKSQEE